MTLTAPGRDATLAIKPVWLRRPWTMPWGVEAQWQDLLDMMVPATRRGWEFQERRIGVFEGVEVRRALSPELRSWALRSEGFVLEIHYVSDPNVPAGRDEQVVDAVLRSIVPLTPVLNSD